MNKIEKVRDLEALKTLLAAADLPVADVSSAQTFFGIYSGSTLVAAVGLELLGSAALLRSLAVSASCRKQGLAQLLVRHAEAYASANGVATLYLLTTTAQSFFERLGFMSTPRASAPQSIALTAQFAGVCSASAEFLSKPVAGLTSHSTGPLQAALAPSGEFNR